MGDETTGARFSRMDFIQRHIALYRSDPEKAHMWDSTPGGGPGLLSTWLWEPMARIDPPYDAYQESAGARRIPVVVLEPR